MSKNIQLLRKSRKLTQEDMRDKGFNYRYFQKIEAGEVNITLDSLVKIARALSCTISDIFKGC